MFRYTILQNIKNERHIPLLYNITEYGSIFDEDDFTEKSFLDFMVNNDDIRNVIPKRQNIFR